jgi:hypothetical protein
VTKENYRHPNCVGYYSAVDMSDEVVDPKGLAEEECHDSCLKVCG